MTFILTLLSKVHWENKFKDFSLQKNGSNSLTNYISLLKYFKMYFGNTNKSFSH